MYYKNFTIMTVIINLNCTFISSALNLHNMQGVLNWLFLVVVNISIPYREKIDLSVKNSFILNVDCLKPHLYNRF